MNNATIAHKTTLTKRDELRYNEEDEVRISIALEFILDAADDIKAGDLGLAKVHCALRFLEKLKPSVRSAAYGYRLNGEFDELLTDPQ